MAQYIAEAYRPNCSTSTLAADVARVRAAAEAAGPVRLLRTLYLPGEEVCFYVFESDRQDLAADAGLWAALGFDRVQSVMAIDEP